jgi:hypothetical protein
VSDAAAFAGLAPNAGTFISAFAPWIALIGGVFLVAWLISLVVSLGDRGDQGAAQVAGAHSSAGKPGKMHDAVLSKASQRILRSRFDPQMIGGRGSMEAGAGRGDRVNGKNPNKIHNQGGTFGYTYGEDVGAAGASAKHGSNDYYNAPYVARRGRKRK